MDTIFALSSGSPPAAIAVVRISGPKAGQALQELAGRVPSGRSARVADLRDEQGGVLDRGLVLWFPGPHTATGEDLAELHLHGGRAVVAAVEAALARKPGFRRALPGEFTRRAFANGRIDLAEAEGLADLLEAETELQRAAAVAAAGGALSREVNAWREQLLALSAQIEATLDFADDDGASELPDSFDRGLTALEQSIESALSAPKAETLREGFRVALAGPPNAGKSTLFNALVQDQASIATPVPGTTRDVLTRAVAMEGIPFMFVDMAGLRDTSEDPIEEIGIERARAEIARSDLVLWLGAEGQGPLGAWEIEPRIDEAVFPAKRKPRHRVSANSGEGLEALRYALCEEARRKMPRPNQNALNSRQRGLLEEAWRTLHAASHERDLLLAAELLRVARKAFDRLIGRSDVEDVLDVLFGRFCIGK